jgi:hypothetical protein
LAVLDAIQQLGADGIYETWSGSAQNIKEQTQASR